MEKVINFEEKLKQSARIEEAHTTFMKSAMELGAEIAMKGSKNPAAVTEVENKFINGLAELLILGLSERMGSK